MQPDSILRNAKIATNSVLSFVEAAAIADRTLSAVGTTARFRANDGVLMSDVHLHQHGQATDEDSPAFQQAPQISRGPGAADRLASHCSGLMG
jgi:hypothetical protein